MSMSSLKNKVTKRIKQQQYSKDYAEIGSYLKRRRKELDITQDSVSNGICSISYLSKIENNQIVPNEFYVKEIMEKLEVDEKEFYTIISDKKYLEQMIKGLFYKDETILQQVYEETAEIHHNRTINLCKLGYHTFHKDYDKNQYIMMLEHLIMNMSDLEMKTYLLIASMYHYDNQKPTIALEMLLLARKIAIKNDYLTSMNEEYLYLVKQELMRKDCANEHYEAAIRIYRQYHNVARIMYLAITKAYYIGLHNPTFGLSLLDAINTEHLDQDNKDFYSYTKGFILFKLNKQSDSILTLKQIEHSSSYYMSKMILLYEICLQEDDQGMVEEIKQSLENYKPDKEDMKQKVYYHFLLEKHSGNTKEYLRDIAIPFSVKISDFIGLQIYVNEIMDICIEYSRYKEATQYYKKLQKEFKKVENILTKT